MVKKEYIDVYKLLDKLAEDIEGLIEHYHIQSESIEPENLNWDFTLIQKGEIKNARHILNLIENLKKGE
jgi:hypothetical protein